MPDPDPYPAHALEHELRSIRKFLRAWDECPPEVRIKHADGAFARPAIVLAAPGFQSEGLGPNIRTVRRLLNVSYYGSDQEDVYRKASWLEWALVRGTYDFNFQALPVYDFSPGVGSETYAGYIIEPDKSSLSGTILPDLDQEWMASVEMRYQVRLGTDTIPYTGGGPTTDPGGPEEETEWPDGPVIPATDPVTVTDIEHTREYPS